MALVAMCLGAASCQKSITVCGVTHSQGGIGSPYPTKWVTLYANKDYQHGTMTITRLYNATLQQDEMINGDADISSYYATGQPVCNAKGSAYLHMVSGCDYEFTLSSVDNIRVTGSFTLDCTDDCEKILLQ